MDLSDRDRGASVTRAQLSIANHERLVKTSRPVCMSTYDVVTVYFCYHHLYVPPLETTNVITMCLCSTGTGAGKTAHAIALGKRLIRDGYRVEYTATVVGPEETTCAGCSSPAAFVRTALALGPRREPYFPISLHTALATPDDIDSSLPTRRLAALQEEIAPRTDVFLVEAGGTPLEGMLLGLSAPEIVRILGAQTLLIAGYSGDTVVDSVLGTQSLLGAPLVGTVIVGIPPAQVDSTQQTIRTILERRGIRVLGMLPEDRLLAAVTVDELVSVLHGTYQCCDSRGRDLVQHLMIGAMEPAHALNYFQRQSHKAVITGGDRPAIQLAALETATCCLILTGGFDPVPDVLSRAQELDVPLVTVDVDTLTAVECAQRLFTNARFRQEKKVQRVVDLFDRHFDYASLYRAMGLHARSLSK